jgi:hypothetical protein
VTTKNQMGCMCALVAACAFANASAQQGGALEAAQACMAQEACRNAVMTEDPKAAKPDDAGPAKDRAAPNNDARKAGALQSESKEAQLFSTATKPAGTQFDELILPDGRRMTKVSRGGISYCVYKESVGLTKGRDQLSDGVRTMVTTCP